MLKKEILQSHGYSNLIENPKDNFTWVGSDEPHASRRRMILEKHPEIKKLYGPDIMLLPKVIFLVVSCISGGIWLSSVPRHWLTILVFSYLVSGTINNSLLLAAHELSHNLCFKSYFLNRCLAIFCNIPQGIPSAVTFRRYHLEHHTLQGSENKDMDIPTYFESKMIGKNILPKTLFILFQGFFYALRPVMVAPKKPGIWEAVNYIVIIITNYLFYKHLGLVANFYFTGGSFIGMGLHPLAGHFIAEHYELSPDTKGQTTDGGPPETFSYYGSGNLLAFNVGYHNEHHDFPNIPGSRLPQVRKIAPEFYNNLKSIDSWSNSLWRFITNKNIGLDSRVKRSHK